MHENGEIKYFDKTVQKGSIWLDTDTQVDTGKNGELLLKNVHSTKHKNKDAYTLLQPQVKELKKIPDLDQHCNDVGEWHTKIQKLIDHFANP